MFLNQPVLSRREEETNVLVCATFIMKKEPFILEKLCPFLLADIGIFIDFLVSEKKKTKMCGVDSCRSFIFKKDEEKQSENISLPRSSNSKVEKKDKILLECVVSTSSAKHILKGVLVTKRKLNGCVVVYLKYVNHGGQSP